MDSLPLGTSLEEVTDPVIAARRFLRGKREGGGGGFGSPIEKLWSQLRHNQYWPGTEQIQYNSDFTVKVPRLMCQVRFKAGSEAMGDGQEYWSLLLVEQGHNSLFQLDL